jgi:type I restriction enzyme S subunit
VVHTIWGELAWQLGPLDATALRMDYGTSGNVRDGKIVLPERGGLDAIPPGLLLENKDLLFNRTNSLDLVGKVGLFSWQAADEITFASYPVRLRVRPEHSPHWLNYLLFRAHQKA